MKGTVARTDVSGSIVSISIPHEAMPLPPRYEVPLQLDPVLTVLDNWFANPRAAYMVDGELRATTADFQGDEVLPNV